MSLSEQQRRATRRELRDNLSKSGLTVEQVADAIGATPRYVEGLFELEPMRLEDTWILRNHLLEAVNAVGRTPTAFTALVGDWHDYWFLDGDYIDRGIIDSEESR